MRSATSSGLTAPSIVLRTALSSERKAVTVYEVMGSPLSRGSPFRPLGQQTHRWEGTVGRRE